MVGQLLFLVYQLSTREATPRLMTEEMHTENDGQSLQNDLQLFQKWEKNWSKQFNVKYQQ